MIFAVDTETLVVFVRHGETALNAERRFRGRADPPLTEKGEAQASRLANHVVRLAPAGIYASPRVRTRTTAEAITGRTEMQATVTAALDDFDYGAWCGKTEAEVRKSWPDLYALWHKNPGQVVFPQGEAVQQVQKRLTDFLLQAQDKYPGQIVVAVTHDAVIRCAICAALDAGMTSYHHITVGLASTTGIRVSRKISHLDWSNNTTHLHESEDRTH